MGILNKLISTPVTLILTIYIHQGAKWVGNIQNVFSSLLWISEFQWDLRHEVVQNSH